MDKSQAKAVADALAEPRLKAQEDLRRKNAIQAKRLARQRFAVWLAAPGAAAGMLTVFFTDEPLFDHIILSAMLGAVVSWTVLGCSYRYLRSSRSSKCKHAD